LLFEHKISQSSAENTFQELQQTTCFWQQCTSSRLVELH